MVWRRQEYNKMNEMRTAVVNARKTIARVAKRIMAEKGWGELLQVRVRGGLWEVIIKLKGMVKRRKLVAAWVIGRSVAAKGGRILFR
jgi:hypothetical protein